MDRGFNTGNAYPVELTVPPRAWQSEQSRNALNYGLLTAALSAQGQRFLPLPMDTKVPQRRLMGGAAIAAVRLPEATVPAPIRREIETLPLDVNGSKVVTIGRGHLGRLLEDVKRTFGIPIFGSNPRDREVRLPNHKEFEASNLVAGGGFIGLALVLPGAARRGSAEGRLWAGCLVPFPELVHGLQADPDNGAIDMRELSEFLSARFGDPILEASVDRLIRLVGSGVNTGPASVPSGAPLALKRRIRSIHHFGQSSPLVAISKIGPAPRWSF